jgi:signal transduction histidine kinase
MWRRNLTAKILLAVGITVAAVIAIYTYFVIRVQSAWWHERTHAQNAIAATLVHEYLEGVMLSDRHQEVQRFLDELQRSGEITRGHIVNLTGRVVFSTQTQLVKQTTVPLPAGLFSGENRALQGVRQEPGDRLAVAMLPVRKRVSCARCHETKEPYLGAIVVEKTFAAADAAIAANRNLMLLYGALIFALVGVVLWLLIVRLVTQPVSSLLAQMRRVEDGDLAARAEPGSADQIGQLAGGFNAMVTSLATTTRELHESHQQQIQQAGKLASIGELASGIAHEIRNPLAGIGAAVEVLATRNENAQDREVVDEIRAQIHRLNNTLRGLLDFARPRAPLIVPCDLCELVRPMIALARPDAQKNGVRIVEECPTEVPPLCGDIQQLQQVVLNLLLNAIQAMPQGGTLTVRAEILDRELVPGHPRAVRLTVADTGIGIEPANQEKIFSPFFTTKHRGTGLGLAISRSIVEKHNGAITVASTPGRGTQMMLELPLCREGACVPHRKEHHGEGQSPHH